MHTEDKLTSNATCPFCDLVEASIIAKRSSVCVVLDRYPVTERHCLIIPMRHVASAIDLSEIEVQESFALVKEVSEILQSKDAQISGFNIGYNVGRAAGQTIDHAHMHLIPRRVGDMPDPRGGVRGVIPSMQKY